VDAKAAPKPNKTAGRVVKNDGRAFVDGDVAALTASLACYTAAEQPNREAERCGV